MAAAGIANERQKIMFAISNMKGRAKTWALTLETTHSGCFANWNTLTDAMREVFLPPNEAHRQRAAFLACAQGDRDLYAYVQGLRQLIASMAANSIPEDVKLTTFIENLKSGPAKAAVFRSGYSTLEEAFAIALAEDYVQRATRGLPANLPPGGSAPPSATGAGEPMDLSTSDLSGVDLSTYDLSVIDVRAFHIKCFACGKMGHFQRNCPRNGGPGIGFQARRGRGVGPQQQRRRISGKRQLPVDAGRFAGVIPNSQYASILPVRNVGRPREDLFSVTDKQRVSGDLIVVTARVKGYARPFKVLIDCGATRNYGRKQSIAENNALFAQACERNLGKISVRLAKGIVAEVSRIEVDLRVAFNDFDSIEHFTVLDMDDRFDLILGMPWLESHEPWIDWRSKGIGSYNPGKNED